MASRSRSRRQLIAVVAAAAPLAACRAHPSEPPSPPPPVRVGLQVGPASLDPHELNEFVTFSTLSNCYEALVGLDPLLRVRPALAESWSSPDERTWRFRLRPGVVFHDGRPLSSADVVFSLERARRHAKGEYASYLATVATVRALGEAEVEVRTHAPNALLLTRLAFVLIAPAGAPDEIQLPIGTGPYVLRPVGRGDPIILTAFDRYWGRSPVVKQVQLQVLRGPQRSRKLQSGEVDLLVDVGPEEAERISSAPGLRLVSHPGPSVDVLHLNLRRPPFSDRRVRRALSLALDRSALVQRMLRGHGAPTGQFVSRNIFGFVPGLPAPARDLTASRRLLAQAGHGSGLDLDLEFRADRDVGEIARQMAEAGFRARLAPRHWHELLDRLHKGQTQVAFLTVVSDSGEAGDVFESTLHTRDVARGYGDSNTTGYSSPAFDGLVEGLGRTPELEKRRQILDRCMRVAAADLPMVPLYERNLIWALRPQVSWQPRSDGRLLAAELGRVAEPPGP